MKWLFAILAMFFFTGQSADKWQVVYYGKYSPNGARYVILDLFEHSSNDVSRAKSSGAKPIAYFSAHYENWRPDAKKFGRKSRKIGGWKGEYYIDWKDSRNQAVMKSRLDRAKSMGYWGVDIDNVDGPGGRDYFPWLYSEAKKRGLKVGLKNFVEILGSYGNKVDFFVTEASSGNELTCYQRFGKPVVRMYYGKGAATPAFIYAVRNKRDGNRF